jgi:hypothetical protein
MSAFDTLMYDEVPFVFPYEDPNPRRYRIDDVDNCATLDTETSTIFNSSNNSSDRLLQTTTNAVASSSECGRINTRLLHPYLLSVTLNNTSLIQLDLSHTVHYKETTTVQAFFMNKNETTIRLILVDAASGVILTLDFDAETLTPHSDCVSTFVLDRKYYTYSTTAQSLFTNTFTNNAQQVVAFLDARRIVLLANSVLLTVHVETKTAVAWTLPRTSFFAAPPPLSPVSTLCGAKNGQVVFSYHGHENCLRRWTLSASLEPDAVHVMSDNVHFVEDASVEHMAAHLYDDDDDKYVLALSTIHDEKDTPKLLVMQGYVHETNMQAVETLHIPETATKLVSLLVNADLQVVALFQTTNNENSYAGGSLLCTYSRTENNNYMTYSAPHEYWIPNNRLQPQYLPTVDMFRQYSLEEALHELDTRYMQLIFRSHWAPSKVKIRRALCQLGHKCQPDTTGGSLPVETLRAIHALQATDDTSLEAHDERWRAFLALLDNDDLPTLLLSSPDATVLLVRPKITTALVETTVQQRGEENAVQALDTKAIELVNALERNDASRMLVVRAEQELWEVVASAALATDSADICKATLQTVIDSIDPMMLELDNDEELLGLTEAALIDSLQKPPLDCNLPGLALLSSRETIEQNGDHVAWLQLCLAASTIAVRCMESARRLFFGRALLLLANHCTPDVERTALRLYMHSLGLLWVSAQRFALPSSRSSPSPRKRINGVVSGDTIRVLDAHFLELVKGVSSSDIDSVVSVCISAARLLVENVLRLDASSGQPFPEMSLVAYTATQYPKLSIRLLAPFVAFSSSTEPDSLLSERKAVLAEMLLRAARHESGWKLEEMAIRAFALLNFDQVDVACSIQRTVSIVDSCARYNLSLASFLVDFVIAQIEALNYRLDAQGVVDDACATLWSSLFSTSIAAQNWSTAMNACMKSPNSMERAILFKELTRAMVVSGNLSVLVNFCAQANREPKDSFFDTFASGREFYAIASETLAEMKLFGELFSVHAHQANWEKATETLDIMYKSAGTALSNNAPSIGYDGFKTREMLALSDLLLSSLGSNLALAFCKEHSCYIATDPFPAFPLSLKNAVGTKRLRFADSWATETVHEPEVKPLASSLLQAGDVELRAALTSALSCLLFDDDTDGSYAKSVMCSKAIMTNTSSPYEIIKLLFARGNYPHGILMASTLTNYWDITTRDESILLVSLRALVNDHLLPIICNPAQVSERPTLQQLYGTIEYISGHSQLPPVIAGGRTKTVDLLQRTNVCLAASALLQVITIRYTSPDVPLALNVAEWFLMQSPNATLSTWLEDVLCYGLGDITDKQERLVFFGARHQSNTFSGDASGLLALYIKHGRYMYACRIVITVLRGQQSRAESAPSRLPEKGDVDVVPYHSIDLLCALMDKSTGLDYVMLDNVRNEMESALMDHFKLLRVSEAGLLSARVLNKN